MGLLVEVNIIVFCFGTGVAYLIAVGDILEPVFENTGLGPWIAGIKPGTPWETSLDDMYVFDTFHHHHHHPPLNIVC